MKTGVHREFLLEFGNGEITAQHLSVENIDIAERKDVVDFLLGKIVGRL